MEKKVEVPEQLNPREDLKSSVNELTDVKKAEVEIVREYREVEVKPYGKLHIHRPSIEDDYNADLVYTDEMNRLLMSNPNIPTYEEQEQRLEKRGIWTTFHKEQMNDLREELAEISSEIFLVKEEYKSKKTSKLKSKIKDLQDKYEALKKEFLKMEGIRSKYFSATVEGRAEEKRFLVRMSHGVRYPSGDKVWKSPEELAKERDSEPVRRIVYEFIAFLQGVDSQVLAELPDILNEVGE